MQLIAQDDAPGRLRGHLARANPLWRALLPGAPVLTLFRGAVHYVSPSWYPAKHEQTRAAPWRVGDAPADYVEGMLRAIVGFEIEINSIEGKFKASQHRAAADRTGVREGLRAAGVPAADIEELCRD